MSVTIVSTLPKLTQAAPVDNATSSDNAVVGQDFARLLQGQLAPVVPEVLAENAEKKELPGDGTTPGDAASLLAALGLMPTDPGRNTISSQSTDASRSGGGKVDKTTSDPLTALQTATASGQNLKPEGKAAPVKTEPVLTGTLAADDKPAKFAVVTALASNAEDVVAKSTSSDSTNNLSTLATSAPTSSNGHVANRDVALAVPTPVRDPNWASDFGQKIVWLASNDKQSAQLTLNPPHMGPIEISLNLDKGQATASFVSANADVRAMIETAMPKLREMFADAGIALGQANVSSESFRQQAGGGGGNGGAAQWPSDNAILAAGSTGSLPARGFSTQQGNGMVDIFA